MIEWITKIDILSLVLGTVASTWYGYYIKRPKLRTSGSGSGSDREFYKNRIHVQNVPGLIGVRYGDTTLFGFQMLRGREFGEVIDRNPAHHCSASLLDRQSNEHICNLWWCGPDRKISQEITLKSGESTELLLFVRRMSEPLKYFPYRARNADTPAPIEPEDHLKFEDTREFIIEIRCSYGKKRIRRGCKMTKGFDGRLRWMVEGCVLLTILSYNR